MTAPREVDETVDVDNLLSPPTAGRELYVLREKMRAWIATAIIVITCAVIVVLAVALMLRILSLDEVKDSALIFLSPLLGLVGTVVGHYFVTHRL